MADKTHAPIVYVIGPQPPPLHGQSQNTRRVATDLSISADVRVIDTSPGSLVRGPFYHCRKILRVLGGVLVLLRARRGPQTRVYLSMDSGWGLVYQQVLCLVTRVRGHRLFQHHRSFAYIDRPSWLMRLVIAAAGRDATHIFLCPDMSAGFARRYGEPHHTLIVSNAAHTTPVDTPTSREPGVPLRIGLLSNLCRDKGLYEFTRLLERCRADGLSVTGYLAGPAVSATDTRHIEYAVTSLGPLLRYLGPVHGDARSDFYRSIDLFLFPTTYKTEAQPNVVIEALAHGVPVIAFGRGCIASDIGDDAGLVVPVGADFCEHALGLLRALSTDAQALADARTSALDRARRLHTSATLGYEAMLHAVSRDSQEAAKASASQNNPTKPVS